MMRSMFSGVSGLRVHQTKMDVIANNIANVNTVGYKSSRATFQDVFSQTLSGASKAAADGTRGGTNPTQIGLGVKLGSVDSIMMSGIPQRTDGAYDCMIDGDGFFIVSDSSGVYFTRAGAFRIDNDGNLTNNEGLLVNGWNAITNPDGTQEINKGKAAPVRIGADDDFIAATETSYIRAAGNLNAYTEPIRETSFYFYDTLGNTYSVGVTMEFMEAGSTPPGSTVALTEPAWIMTADNYCVVNGDESNRYYINTGTAGTADLLIPNSGVNPQAFQLEIGAKIPAGDPIVVNTANPRLNLGQLTFNDHGYLDVDGTTGSMTSLQITVVDGGTPLPNLQPVAAFASEIVMNFEDLLQQETTSNGSFVTQNGNAPGKLARISIDSNGIVMGSYTNGESKMIAQIAIAQFKNPAGLERYGNNLFIATRNSGDYDGVGVEANAIGSTIMGGVLEMANVDLASEFTEMITTQRGFQANSRTITTSDEMLQELVNLKR